VTIAHANIFVLLRKSHPRTSASHFNLSALTRHLQYQGTTYSPPGSLQLTVKIMKIIMSFRNIT